MLLISSLVIVGMFLLFDCIVKYVLYGDRERHGAEDEKIELVDLPCV